MKEVKVKRGDELSQRTYGEGEKKAGDGVLEKFYIKGGQKIQKGVKYVGIWEGKKRRASIKQVGECQQCDSLDESIEGAATGQFNSHLQL